MPMIFYPHEGELEASNLDQKIEALMESAERYKAMMLDPTTNTAPDPTKVMTPRLITHAYNWEDLAKTFREVRDLPEATPSGKTAKADKLTKLAGVYEVLRGAKMPKLEAVRLALISEANQLRGGSSQVA